MDKKLAAYVKYIEKESAKPSAELIEYHKTMLQHFQHERFIHLVVTMFTTLFMIIFFIAFVCLGIFLPASLWSNIISGIFGTLTLALLVTAVLYLRHYYLLENGVERLEDITRKLYGRDFYKK